MFGRTSRPSVRLLAAVAVAVALGLALLVNSGKEARAGETTSLRPNFVVVMTDDQPPGMMKALPSVERLIGNRGATFTNAFVSYPLCCPSRATFLTGQYAHNHGTHGNTPQSGGGYPALNDKGSTLASWLQAAGYETAFAGKWLNGLRTPKAAPPGWDRWAGLVGAGGESLSSFYDFDIFQAAAQPLHYGTAPGDYQTDVLVRDYALPLISEQAATPEPFFLWLAMHPPHDGLGRDDAAGRRCSIGEPDSRGAKQSAIPPPRYARRFAHAAVPRPPSFDEADVSDKPEEIAKSERLSGTDLEIIRLNYRCGLAALLAVDDAVRQIVATLEQTGQLSNTVLIFTSDNGALAGEHRVKAGKNRPYDEALRVPLEISGPTILAGSHPAGPVVNADLAPTILDLAGATIPPDLARTPDGTSLTAALRNGTNAETRAIPIEGRDNVVASKHGFKATSYVGVRTSRWSYVEYRRASSASKPAAIALPIGAGRTIGVELYDMRRDPYQLENLAEVRGYRMVRTTLRGVMRSLERCEGAECVVDAAVPDPRPARFGPWFGGGAEGHGRGPGRSAAALRGSRHRGRGAGERRGGRCVDAAEHHPDLDRRSDGGVDGLHAPGDAADR